MAKLIITAGCSFTTGIELDDYQDHWSVGLESSNLIWSYNIKEKLWPDAEFLNVAKSGADNSTITRRTIHYVSEKLSKYKPEDIIVLVMWTGIDRREWRLGNDYKSQKKYNMSETNFLSSTATDANLCIYNNTELKKLMKEFFNEEWVDFRRDSIIDKGMEKILSEYYKKHVSNENGIYYSLSNINYLHNFLDKHKIKHFNTNAFQDLIRDTKLVEGRDMFIDGLIKNVDFKKFFVYDGDIGFTEFTEKKKFPLCEYGHPGKDAHAAWAIEMSKWIDTKLKYKS
jgi:hypothetical protein